MESTNASRQTQVQTQIEYKNEATSTGAVLCGLCGIVAGLILAATGIAVSVKFSAEMTSCMVTNVTYPTELPSTPEEINDNFVQCDCGKFCTSDLGYCVKIYVSTPGSNATFLLGNEVETSSVDIQCTFYETKCPLGEHMSDRLLALDEAEEIASPYLNYLNSSTPFDCYKSGGELFLSNNVQDAINILIGLGCFTGFCLILTVLFARYDRR